MDIERVQKSLYWAIIVSEATHVFCCVLPTIFSILTLAAGLGLLATVPAGLTVLHDMLHAWEVPMILMSGFFIALGWGIHYLAKRIDCHNTGCAHGPCTPKKNKAGSILKFATVLFTFNVGIYLFFHHGLETLAAAMG